MNKEKFFFWLPRALSIIFILFLGLFALDIFIPDQPLSYYLIGLFMHLLPNLLLIALLAIAWKWEKIGGILFVPLGLIFTIFFNTYTSIPTFLFISFPVFLIGTLFLIDNYLRNSHKLK